MNIFRFFEQRVEAALAALVQEGALPPGLDYTRVAVEPPRDPSHGDLSTNAAMVLAKPAGANRAILQKCLPRGSRQKRR